MKRRLVIRIDANKKTCSRRCQHLYAFDTFSDGNDYRCDLFGIYLGFAARPPNRLPECIAAEREASK